MSGRERGGRNGGDGGLLPPAGAIRWTPRQKARVVVAVRERRLAVEEACRRYSLAPEELAAWERDLDQHGEKGLRVRHLHTWRGRRATRGEAGPEPASAQTGTRAHRASPGRPSA